MAEKVMADKKADKKKEDIGTRVFNSLTTMVAGFVARKVITFAWTKVTGKEPPTNPEDPRVALAEAFSWSVLTGITVAAFRLLAIRAVARRTLSGADREPANATDG
jgi:Protein of unknown function (DUF4235)